MNTILDIELLVLDLSRCTLCRETEDALEIALVEAASALAHHGVSVRVTKPS